MKIERADVVAVPSTDWERSRAFFHDPDGNDLMLHHRYAPHAEGRTDS